MAEVFLSRMAGPQGFERLVALKKVRSRLTEDPRFVERLVSEARIMVRLSHGNICQVLDFGMMDGQYFLAMEYVSGCDLSVLLHGLSMSHEAFPPVLAAFITAEVCRGLDYAHRRSDESGRPLGVVHRDVTPENVLISHDGEVKLTDFGISMARGLGTPEDGEGVVVGKAAYLAPEQLTGTSGDARTDVFSTGILLWEMLVGRPLFRRAGQRETIDAVLRQPIVPPSRLRPEVPAELDAITQRALARKPGDRYPSAAAMLEDVSRFLAATAPGITGAPLAELVARLSPRTISTDEALQTTEVTVPHEVVSLATSDVPSSGTRRPMPSRPSLPAAAPALVMPAMPAPTGAVPARPSTVPFEAPAPARSRVLLPAALLAAFAVVAVVGVALALRPEPALRSTPLGTAALGSGAGPGLQPPPAPGDARAETLAPPGVPGGSLSGSGSDPGFQPPAAPGDARQDVVAPPGAPGGSSSGSGSGSGSSSAAPGGSSAGAGGHREPREPREPGRGVGANAGGGAERPPPPRGEGGFINVNARPWGKVYVDGRLLADETPARLSVGSGPHVVKVYFVTAARYSPARQVTVEPGQTRGMFFELQEAP